MASVRSMRFRIDSRALREFLHYSRPYWAVGLIFAVTLAAVSVGPALSQSFSGLRIAGPYAVLITAMGLAWWFNRGRSFVIAASLLLGWTMMQQIPGKAAYAAAVVLVPLNCLAAVVGPERGVRYGAAYRWLAILAAEIVLVFWFSRTALSFDHWWLRSPPTPLVGRVVFAAAFVAAIWRAHAERKPMQIAHAGALVAFFVAAEWAGRPAVYGAFMAAAGVMLLVARARESLNPVFRDELTGL